MEKFKRILKRVVLDLLGYTMLVLAFIVGPFPGPGGIPMFLGGLKVLSIHNPWAKKLLQYMIDTCLDLGDLIFPDKLAIQRVWDAALTLILALNGYLIYLFVKEHGWQLDDWRFVVLTLALGFFITGLLRNRHRFKRMVKRLRNN